MAVPLHQPPVPGENCNSPSRFQDPWFATASTCIRIDPWNNPFAVRRSLSATFVCAVRWRTASLVAGESGLVEARLKIPLCGIRWSSKLLSRCDTCLAMWRDVEVTVYSEQLHVYQQRGIWFVGCQESRESGNVWTSPLRCQVVHIERQWSILEAQYW